MWHFHILKCEEMTFPVPRKIKDVQMSFPLEMRGFQPIMKNPWGNRSAFHQIKNQQI